MQLLGLYYLLVFAENNDKILIFKLSSIIIKYGKYEPELKSEIKRSEIKSKRQTY